MKNAKSRLLALLLCLVIFVNAFAMSSCNIIFNPNDGDSELGGGEDGGDNGNENDEVGGADENEDEKHPDEDEEDKKPPSFDDWVSGTVATSYRISEEKLRSTLEKTLDKIDFCIESYGEG